MAKFNCESIETMHYLCRTLRSRINSSSSPSSPDIIASSKHRRYRRSSYMNISSSTQIGEPIWLGAFRFARSIAVSLLVFASFIHHFSPHLSTPYHSFHFALAEEILDQLICLRSNGFFPHDVRCDHFYECRNTTIINEGICKAGLRFDYRYRKKPRCIAAELIDCRVTQIDAAPLPLPPLPDTSLSLFNNHHNHNHHSSSSSGSSSVTTTPAPTTTSPTIITTRAPSSSSSSSSSTSSLSSWFATPSPLTIGHNHKQRISVPLQFTSTTTPSPTPFFTTVGTTSTTSRGKSTQITTTTTTTAQHLNTRARSRAKKLNSLNANDEIDDDNDDDADDHERRDIDVDDRRHNRQRHREDRDGNRHNSHSSNRHNGEEDDDEDHGNLHHHNHHENALTKKRKLIRKPVKLRRGHLQESSAPFVATTGRGVGGGGGGEENEDAIALFDNSLVSRAVSAQFSSSPPLGRSPIRSAHCAQPNGYFADREDCRKFYACDDGRAFAMSCPLGLAYDEMSGTCNWPDMVEGCRGEEMLRFTCPDSFEHDLLDYGDPRYPTSDCRKFVVCLLSDLYGNRTPRLLGCEEGLVFNPDTKNCDLPEHVPTCANYYDSNPSALNSANKLRRAQLSLPKRRRIRH